MDIGEGVLIIYYLLLNDLFSIYYLKTVDNISAVVYNVFNQSGKGRHYVPYNLMDGWMGYARDYFTY